MIWIYNISDPANIVQLTKSMYLTAPDRCLPSCVEMEILSKLWKLCPQNTTQSHPASCVALTSPIRNAWHSSQLNSARRVALTQLDAIVAVGDVVAACSAVRRPWAPCWCTSGVHLVRASADGCWAPDSWLSKTRSTQIYGVLYANVCMCISQRNLCYEMYMRRARRRSSCSWVIGVFVYHFVHASSSSSWALNHTLCNGQLIERHSHQMGRLQFALTVRRQQSSRVQQNNTAKSVNEQPVMSHQFPTIIRWSAARVNAHTH